MIEPIALGKPVVVGPDLANFEAIAEALFAADALVRSERTTLAATIRSLLEDSGRIEGLVTHGRAHIHERQGATAIHAELLAELATRTLAT